jgi:phage terminase large subunit
MLETLQRLAAQERRLDRLLPPSPAEPEPEEAEPGAESSAEQRLRWAHDPVAYAEECLGVSLWEKQKEILRKVAANGRTAVRSGHKIGKSNTASVLAVWWTAFPEVRPEARCILTSAGARQVRTILWRELKKLHGQKKSVIGGHLNELPSNGLQWGDGREIIGFTAKDAEKIAGISGAHLLFIVDEASGVAEEIFEAVEGNRAGGAKILLLSNPTQTSGTFFDAFHTSRAFYATIHVSSEDTPNCREGRLVIPGLATREWVEEKLKEWGEGDPRFQVRVRGNFPLESSDTIIGLGLVERALLAWDDLEYVGPLVLGVDVARFGDDDTVIAPRRGKKVYPLIRLHSLDTEEVAAKVHEAAVKLRLSPEEVPRVNVDVIGIGAGVFDKLRRIKALHAVGVDASATAPDAVNYANTRAQLWFNLRDFLKGGGGIPNDPKMETEMVAPKYQFGADGRYRVEPKDDIKERIGRSPDAAEAVMLSCWEAGPPPMKVQRPTSGSRRDMSGW